MLVIVSRVCTDTIKIRSTGLIYKTSFPNNVYKTCLISCLVNIVVTVTLARTSHDCPNLRRSTHSEQRAIAGKE